MMQTLCKRSDWGYPHDGVDPPAWYPFSGERFQGTREEEQRRERVGALLRES
jgi:hypothetical protein